MHCTPVYESSYRKISPEMWSTYIGEAIQSGHHRKYCMKHNLSLTTHSMTNSNCINNLLTRGTGRLSHRVFTDSTEKQAVEPYDIKV